MQEKLIYYLHKERITIYELHKRSSVSLSYLYNLFHGRMENPSIKILTMIAFSLNCDLEDLLRQ